MLQVGLLRVQSERQIRKDSALENHRWTMQNDYSVQSSNSPLQHSKTLSEIDTACEYARARSAQPL